MVLCVFLCFVFGGSGWIFWGFGCPLCVVVFFLGLSFAGFFILVLAFLGSVVGVCFGVLKCLLGVVCGVVCCFVVSWFKCCFFLMGGFFVGLLYVWFLCLFFCVF